ncbi:MAG: oleU, partial [Deltaproteobacteria bacterium]|nr:oleU [Deltaproteobacteria bacterium]
MALRHRSTFDLVKVLVTGAAGLIGSHLAQGFATNHDVLALKHQDLDITDPAAVRSRVAAERPSLIVNCAVVQVEEAERDAAEATAVNVEGAGFLAEAAAR